MDCSAARSLWLDIFFNRCCFQQMRAVVSLSCFAHLFTWNVGWYDDISLQISWFRWNESGVNLTCTVFCQWVWLDNWRFCTIPRCSFFCLPSINPATSNRNIAIGIFHQLARCLALPSNKLTKRSGRSTRKVEQVDHGRSFSWETHGFR